MAKTVQSYEIRTDVRGLIRLLAKNLYAQPDVFLREMIQNAQDAIIRRRELEGARAPEGKIHIQVNWETGQNTITFEDNGAGLTESEVHEYLATIGRSGTDVFRQELVKKGRYVEAANLIGQFGIGLLSAFVVAERVVVHTRSCLPDSQGWRWECRGDKDYTLVPDDSLTDPGSRVVLYIDEAHRDVLDLGVIRSAVQKYADFIDVPIHLDEEGRINAVDAPWHRSYPSEQERLDEYMHFVNRRFADVPLSIMPVDIEKPYPVKGVLFISNRRRGDLAAPGRVDIYQSRMFIVSEHPDMLPVWAKFVSGIIDSPALTPTAARDNIQQDSVFRAIRDELGRIIIDHLKRMAAENLRRFQEVMDYHHYHIKGMALEADDFFREVADLLPFETNAGPMSLRDYLADAVKDRDGRRTILYFSERGTSTQFFMLADAKGIQVIDASYIYESQFLQKYANEHPNIKLEQLDFTASDIIFQPLSIEESDRFRDVLNEFNQNMAQGSYAKIVRFLPKNIPAVLTLTEAQKLRRQLDALKDNPIIPNEIRELVGRVVEERPILPVTIHLNADNPTIQALAQMNLRTEVGINAMTAIYNNALMLAHHLITPRNAEAMFTQFNRVIDLLITETRGAEALRRQVTELELATRSARQAQTEALTPHVSCFVAFDFAKRGELFEALRDVLQDRPYCWEVVRADEVVDNPDLLPNLTEKMCRAHCFVAEISDGNPNVMIELGMMLSLQRPFLLLRDARVKMQHWANLQGKLFESYKTSGDVPLHQQLQEIIHRQNGLQDIVRKVHPFFLSPVLLRGSGVDIAMIEAVCREYSTVQSFLEAKPEAIAQRLHANKFVINALQEHAREYCGLKAEL